MTASSMRSGPTVAVRQPERQPAPYGLRAIALVALGIPALGLVVALILTQWWPLFGMVLVALAGTALGVWFDKRVAWILSPVVGVPLFVMVYLEMAISSPGYAEYPPVAPLYVGAYVAALAGSAVLVVLPILSSAYRNTAGRRVAYVIVLLALMALLARCSAPVVWNWLT